MLRNFLAFWLLGAAAGFAAASPSTILDIQAFKVSETQKMPPENLQNSGDVKSVSQGPAKEARRGHATLINLNSKVNSWFLLKVLWPDRKAVQIFHLENPNPASQKVMLPAAGTAGLVIEKDGASFACDIWSEAFREDLRKAWLNQNPYASICDERLYVRFKTEGRKTAKEAVVEFLRDNVWGGEEITNFVKDSVFKDNFLIHSEVSQGEKDKSDEADATRHPLNAAIEEKFSDLLVEPKDLGIKIPFGQTSRMRIGRWYEHGQAPGVYVSVVIPDRIENSILASHKTRVNALDAVEKEATVYLVAFDLSEFDLGFAMGTDHPRVDWSSRALPEAINRSLPGPDGIGDWNPLAMTGMLNPILAKRVVATFTGGFKRDHAAFKWGRLATVNNGSHYGLMESGVVFSRLNPSLATLMVTVDGNVEMKTWADQDKSRLSTLRFARQNGVPIIDYDEEKKESLPGDLIRSWGGGNWSGSEDSKFRTLRAGVCLQTNGQEPGYLIYGYFSSVTPSAMARVFQAYRCRYAMHLDMNALEHTYLAVYPNDGKKTSIEHLIAGMKVLDKSYQEQDVPRFVGFPDNRDFFYLVRKSQ